MRGSPTKCVSVSMVLVIGAAMGIGSGQCWGGDQSEEDRHRESVRTIFDTMPYAEFGQADRLTELGKNAVPAMCEALMEQRTTSGEFRALCAALARIGSSLASEPLCECLAAILNDPKGMQQRGSFVMRALRHCEARQAESLLFAILDRGRGVENRRSELLERALDAAGTLAVVGSPVVRDRAKQFIVTTAKRVPMGSEDPAYYSLLLAMTQIDTDFAHGYLVEALSQALRIEDEFCVSLPRNAPREIVEALYQRLEEESRQRDFGGGPSTVRAALEALDEMNLSDEVVPREFWQRFWDENASYIVRESSVTPMPERVSEESLTPRIKRLMGRRGIQLRH